MEWFHGRGGSRGHSLCGGGGKFADRWYCYPGMLSIVRNTGILGRILRGVGAPRHNSVLVLADAVPCWLGQLLESCHLVKGSARGGVCSSAGFVPTRGLGSSAAGRIGARPRMLLLPHQREGL